MFFLARQECLLRVVARHALIGHDLTLNNHRALLQPLYKHRWS